MESTQAAGPKRLDSWKEIASYFSKDVRTVRRWEQQRGLPVHRVPGAGRTSVYAFVPELETWLQAGRSQHAFDPDGDPDVESDGRPGSMEPAANASVLPAEVREAVPHPSGIFGLSYYELVVVLALLVACTAAIVLSVRRSAVVKAQASVQPEQAPVNPRARELYLQGRYRWSQRTDDSLKQAAERFQQAIDVDPQYAAAYAGLADSYLLLRQYGSMPDTEAYERAYAASRRALELDPTSVEAHRSYAFVLNFWMWNFAAAEAEFRRAIELDPKDAQSHHWYATSLLSTGRYADALREIEVARQLQPDSVAILANRGFILRTIDPNQSLSALLEVERTAPEFAYVHRYLSFVRLDLGQDEEFLTERAAYEQLKHRNSEVDATARAATALTRHGHEAMLTSLAESYGRLAETTDSPDAMDAALFYAKLKDAPHTLQYLELSCSRHESNFRVVANEPDYQFLLGNPEFQTLVTRSRTPLTIRPTRREPLVGMRQDPA